MIKLPKAAVWACAVFLALVFGFSGFLKFAGASSVRWSERFARWGYPPNTEYLVGVLEMLGGIGLLIPRWRRAAAAVLVALMVGALGTHVVHREFSRLVPPLVLGGLALLVHWSDRTRGPKV